MEPATAALLISAVGTIGSTVAGISQARGQARAAELEGQMARDKAQIEERQYRSRAATILGKQEAIIGASGVDPSTGTPLEVMMDQARKAEEEALTIRYGGELEEYSARTRARQARGQIPGIIAGGIGQGGSLLSQYMKK